MRRLATQMIVAEKCGVGLNVEQLAAALKLTMPAPLTLGSLQSSRGGPGGGTNRKQLLAAGHVAVLFTVR